MFTKKAFTKERLERLDEFIQSEFKYAEGVQIGELFDEDDEPDEDVDVDDMIKGQMDE